MQIISEQQVQALLRPAELVEAIKHGFREVYPRAVMPTRMSVSVNSQSTLLLMPCSDPASAAAGIKNVFVSDKTGVQASYILLDLQSGQPSLVMAVNYLTDLRTAATSLVATRHLARRDARTLGIFGTGRQARAHFNVFTQLGNFERVLVSGTSLAAASQFAQTATGELKPQAVDHDTCAAEADVICTCTTSPSPLFDGKRLRPGAHLNLVGAYQPSTREVDDATMQRARVFVDTHAGAMAEAGDILIPMESGAIPGNHIAGDLHELVSGKKAGRQNSEQI